MKTKVLILLLLITGISYAQDQIFKKDNSKIEAKILEITTSEIKYKLFTYQDGPIITMLKNEVVLIIYQNGTHEVFNQNSSSSTQSPYSVYNSINEYEKNIKEERQKKYIELTSTKNLISFNFFEPIAGSIGFSYLRELKNNSFNLYVPVGFGFATPSISQGALPSGVKSNNYSYNKTTINSFTFNTKVFEAGIGFHFQTVSKRAFTHFIGPYIGLAQFNGTYNEGISVQTGQYNYQNYNIEHGFVMNRYHFFINNGLLFRITKNFNMILIGGVGKFYDDFVSNSPNNFVKNSYKYSDASFPVNSFKIGFSAGYRF